MIFREGCKRSECYVQCRYQFKGEVYYPPDNNKIYTLGEASRSELEGSGSFEDMELKDGELSRLQGQM